MPTIKTGGYEFVYHEKQGSPKEMCSGDVFRAQRTFDVPYDFRWVFIKAMLGTAAIKGAGTSSSITRELPDQYYVFYGKATPKAFMVATTLESLENIGEQKIYADDNLAGSKLITSGYKVARITIGYESVTYDVKTDAEMGSETEYGLKRFVTVFRQPTAEFLTLPQGAFRWVEEDDFGNSKLDSSGNPCGVKVVGSNGKIISAQEIIVVHHRVPGIPKAVNTHIGSVNKEDWPGLRALKGQLLLANIELKPYRWLDETRLYDITYKFKFFDPDPEASKKTPTRPRGHNWFMQYFPGNLCDPSGGITSLDAIIPKYKLMTHNGKYDGRTVYEEKSMKDLFTDFVDTKDGQY